MAFTSAIYLFVFFPISMGLYYISGKKLRNVVLLILSLLFYAWGDPKRIVWLILSMIVCFVTGLAMERAGTAEKEILKTAILIAVIVFEVGVLSYYKFATDSLPIGISFYTFKCLSYVIDVYKGKIRAEKNPMYLSIYISFFPQLMAGPITRYEDIGPQIANREINMDQICKGAIRFMIGFSKKILLSDQLVEFVTLSYSEAGHSAPLAWITLLAYHFEIFFDFTGYSDMAIGLGMMLGFETKENFNQPYTATSIQDFWRRWHISLSSWFRDYVYIPLGGSRKGELRTYLNIAIVFVLTGIWHGSAKNYIAWGLYFVIFMWLERAGLRKVLERLPKVAQQSYTMLVVVVGWAFFRSEGLVNAFRFVKNLFVINPDSLRKLIGLMDLKIICCMVLGAILSSAVAAKLYATLEKRQWALNVCVILVFVLAVAYMWAGGFTSFLYFKF